MIKHLLLLITATTLGVVPANAETKDEVLFVGDGVGVSSLNTASSFGPGQPQGLYLHKMPRLASLDTSTAREWVTGAAASATAWATGHQGRNGVISMSANAVRGVKDGEIPALDVRVREFVLPNPLSLCGIRTAIAQPK